MLICNSCCLNFKKFNPNDSILRLLLIFEKSAKDLLVHTEELCQIYLIGLDLSVWDELRFCSSSKYTFRSLPRICVDNLYYCRRQ